MELCVPVMTARLKFKAACQMPPNGHPRIMHRTDDNLIDHGLQKEGQVVIAKADSQGAAIAWKLGPAPVANDGHGLWRLVIGAAAACGVHRRVCSGPRRPH
jgi:hypothetical protein